MHSRTRLIIGCGERKWEGGVHVDLRETPVVDIIHDLDSLPWPLRDEEFEEVIAEDIIEHLKEIVPVVEECWRVLKPGGTLWVQTPHYTSPNSYHDPTHRWHLSEHSFDYFDPSTTFGKKYPHYSPRKFRLRQREVREGNVEVLLEKIP